MTYKLYTQNESFIFSDKNKALNEFYFQESLGEKCELYFISNGKIGSFTKIKG